MWWRLWNFIESQVTAVFFDLFTILNFRHSSKPISWVYFWNWPITLLCESKKIDKYCCIDLFSNSFFWFFFLLLFTTWNFMWLKKGQIDYKRAKKWHTISRLVNFDMISFSQSCYDNNLIRSKKVKLMDFFQLYVSQLCMYYLTKINV